MKTAAQFFAEYFECEVREAKECHHMTIDCMEKFAQEACREQREICAQVYNRSTLNFPESEIKNAPEPNIINI